jgi:5-methyltetrahydropteroyltriglutamate--homocysteine methyltransferase
MKFLTHEVGSLAKPEWRVRAIAGKPIREKDIQGAIGWGKRLGIDNADLIAILRRENLSDGDKQKVKEWASLYAIRMEEAAGLAVVYDGEQQRSEMYHYPVSHSDGFEFIGHVRSFDNKYYKKAAVVSKPAFRRPYHLEEFRFARSVAKKPLKVPVTGAYTIVDWSFDEFYLAADLPLGTSGRQKARGTARSSFVKDTARELIRPNLQALVKAGADWIQIDEPAVTTHPDEIPLFVEAFQESTAGIDCRFGIHICFSDYGNLFPHVMKIDNCHEYTLEFANRDSKDLGTADENRPGYQILKLFKREGLPAKLGLGVVDIHTDFIEPPELIRDRILYAVKVLGDPEKIYPTTDCGLRTRTWDVAFAKLNNLVKGTRLAEKILASG